MAKPQELRIRRYEYAPLNLEREFPIRADIRWRYDGADPYAPPHVHNCLELGYCHAGAGVFLIADKVRPFAAGDCVIVNDREPHCALNRPRERSEWSWLYIDAPGMISPAVSAMPHLLPLADISPFAGPRFDNVRSPARYPFECALVRGMVDDLGGRPAFHHDTVRLALLLLLARLHREHPRHNAEPRAAMGGVSHAGALARLEPALRFIAAHFHEHMTIGQLARLCSMGAENFRRIFNDAIRTTPKRYIINMRIARACLALKSSARPIGLVALENGFPDLSCFNREFKRQLGTSPREWRRQAG